MSANFCQPLIPRIRLEGPLLEGCLRRHPGARRFHHSVLGALHRQGFRGYGVGPRDLRPLWGFDRHQPNLRSGEHEDRPGRTVTDSHDHEIPRRESEIRKSRGLGRSPQRATGGFAPPGLSDGTRECSRIAGRRFSGDLQLALRLTDFARGVARVSLASRFAVPRTLFASLRAILDASRPAIGCATDTALIRNVSFAGTECRRRLLQTCSLESIAKN